MQRLPYLSVEQAMRVKRVSRTALWRHARQGAFDTLRVGRVRLIVNNARWRKWEPNRQRQRAILHGLRQRSRRSSLSLHS